MSLFWHYFLLCALVHVVVGPKGEFGALVRHTKYAGTLVHRSLERIALPAEYVVGVLTITSPSEKFS